MNIAARIATVARIARQAAVALCAISLLANVFVTPAFAEHVIPVLGTQPVLGRLTSTEDLQRQTVDQRSEFETAAQMIGLTSSQTHVLETRIANKQLTYGLVPRHLEATTGKEAGRVFLERDVLIPANTYGWEIDIPDGHQIIAVYIPAACGNLSLVHRSAPPPTCPHGMNGTDPNCFAPTCPQGMQGTPPNCAAPVCPAGMLGTPPNCSAPPTPAPAPPSPETTPPPPPTQHKAAVLWPLLLLGGLLIHGGSLPPPPPPSGCP